MADRFEKHARTVTALTFLSRMTGLARDAALSRIFGISPVIDAFWFAFMIPNLFRRLFGEGALSAAFIPEYTRLHRNDPIVARQLARFTISSLIALLAMLTIIGELLLLLILSRAGEDVNSLPVELMMIVLPYMPMVCLVAIMGAMLQVHGRFGPTAAAPILLNLCIVVAAVGFTLAGANEAERAAHEVTHITFIAIAVLIAGGLQALWSVLALRQISTQQSPADQATSGTGASPHDAVRASFRQMLRNFWPMLIGLGVLQLNVFVDGLIASYPTTFGPTIFGIEYPLKQGAITALSNAQRLYEFPLGVFGIAVATAIFPALAKLSHDAEAFTDTLRRGVRLVIFIGLPASVGLMLVRLPLTAAILQGKNFTPDDTQRVAFVLMGYAPAIWAYSMTHTLTRAFYARGDSRTPVKVAVGMVGLNLTLNLLLIWTPLREAGLAWSTAICAIVQVLILLRLITRHAPYLVDQSVWRGWARTMIVTAAMAIAVIAVDTLLSPNSALAGTWRWAVIELAALVAVGGATVASLAISMRMPEFHWAIGRTRD